MCRERVGGIGTTRLDCCDDHAPSRNRATTQSMRTFERKKTSEDLGDLRSFRRGGRTGW